MLKYEAHHLRRRPARAIATVLGLALGAGLLFSALTVQSNLESVAAEDGKGLGGDADFLVLPVFRSHLSMADRRSVRSTDGVETAVPVVKASATIRADGSSERILLFGVSRQLPTLFPEGLGTAGKQIAQLRQGRILVTSAVSAWMENARSLVLSGGHLAPQEMAPTPFQRLHGGQFALTTIRQVHELVPPEAQTELLYVKAASNASRQALKSNLEVALTGHGLVLRSTDLAGLYQGPVRAIALFIYFAAFIAFQVLLLIVFTSSSRALTERQREIALIAALGATRLQLFTTLLASTLVLGCIAGLAGIALALPTGGFILRRATASYPLLPEANDFTLVASASHIAVVLAVTVGVTLIAAWLPVKRVVDAHVVAAADPAEQERGSAGKQGVVERRRLIAVWPFSAMAISALLMVNAPTERLRLALLMALGIAMGLAALPLLTQAGVTTVIFLTRRWSNPAFLAARNLQRHPARTTAMLGVLSFAGAIALGMAISLAAVEGKVTQVMKDRYDPPLYVTASSFSGLTSDRPLSGKWAKSLDGLPGVRAVFPFRIRVIPSGGGVTVVVSAPMVRELAAGFSNAILETEGRRQAILRGLRRGGVVVSQRTYDSHNLRLGRRLMLGGIAVAPAPRVVGVYEDILGADALYTERSTYIRLSGDSSVDRFAIAPIHGASRAALRSRLRDFVDSHGIPAVVEGKKQVISRVLEAPRQAFAFGWAIVAIIALAAGLIVFNAVATATREQRWEFALCRAIGMTRSQVVGGLVFQSLALGIIAALLALAAGLAVASLLAGMMGEGLGLRIHPHLGGLALAGAFVGPIVLAGCAAAVPAAVAARKASLPAVKDL